MCQLGTYMYLSPWPQVYAFLKKLKQQLIVIINGRLSKGVVGHTGIKVMSSNLIQCTISQVTVLVVLRYHAGVVMDRIGWIFFFMLQVKTIKHTHTRARALTHLWNLCCYESLWYWLTYVDQGEPSLHCVSCNIPVGYSDYSVGVQCSKDQVGVV